MFALWSWYCEYRKGFYSGILWENIPIKLVNDFKASETMEDGLNDTNFGQIKQIFHAALILIEYVKLIKCFSQYSWSQFSKY